MISAENTIEPAAITIPVAFQPDIARAVHILKEGGCSEVFLFGSLAAGRSRANSDIDLAVRGCPPGEFFHLYGKLMGALEHQVDLVKLDTTDPFAQFLLEHGGLLRVG